MTFDALLENRTSLPKLQHNRSLLALEELGRSLGQVRGSKLKLKPGKTEVSVEGPHPNRGSGCALMLDGAALFWKDQICSLGVVLVLVPALLLDKKVEAVARSAFTSLDWHDSCDPSWS